MNAVNQEMTHPMTLHLKGQSARTPATKQDCIQAVCVHFSQAKSQNSTIVFPALTVTL